MKNITLIIAGLLLVGCASTSGIYKNKAGDKLEIRSTRFLWQTEQVRIAMQSNSFPEVEINKTQSDSEAITASAGAIGTIMGAVAKGAAGK